MFWDEESKKKNLKKKNERKEKDTLPPFYCQMFWRQTFFWGGERWGAYYIVDLMSEETYVYFIQNTNLSDQLNVNVELYVSTRFQVDIDVHREIMPPWEVP